MTLDTPPHTFTPHVHPTPPHPMCTPPYVHPTTQKPTASFLARLKNAADLQAQQENNAAMPRE